MRQFVRGKLPRILVLAVISAALLAVAGPAWADSLVYVKGSGGTGNVWISRPDGTNQRQVTQGGGYAWPSEADNGTIVALGPGEVAPDGTRGMDIYRMRQDGTVINKIPTHSDYSDQGCPAYPPNNVRVSPDGTGISYSEFVCGHLATYWTSSGSTGLDFPNQTLGQEDYGDPFWMRNGRLLLTHGGVPWNTNDTFTTYDTANGDNSSRSWFGDTTEVDPSNPNGWATGFNAAISRQNDKVAVYEDDAANWLDGMPRKVVIRLFTTNGAPPAQPTFRCQINLPAGKFPYGAGLDSLGFTSDGGQLVWEDADGIHAANTNDLSDCSTIEQRLLIPGGINSFLSPANVQTVDTVAPNGTVKINGGALCTRSPSVTLSLSATDPAPATGVASMRFINDGGSWSAWQPYATSRSWTLRNTNGTRTVYVQYRDKAGNVSKNALDTIKLDTIRPTITGMSPTFGSTTTDTTPTIKATVRDNMTNLQKANIRLYVNGVLISASRYSYSASTDALVYNSPRLSLGRQTARIVARDAAGNVGARSWYFTIK